MVLFVLIGGVSVALLAVDGVRLRDIGASGRYLLPAVLAFVGIYVGLNVVGVGLAVAFDLPWGVDLITATVPLPFDSLPAAWVAFIVLEFLVGFTEELSVRGFFQNKVIALLGGGSVRRIAAGVLIASLVFGALHVPGVLLLGAGVVGVVGVVVSRSLTGVAFGTVYELTRNVYLVALLHGLGNTWPLLIDWSRWTGTQVAAFFAGVALVYVCATLGYRYLATGTTLRPTVRRSDSGPLSVSI